MPQICLILQRKKNISMINTFHDFSASDKALLQDAPLWVAIWVGIADNHYDQEEQIKTLRTLAVKTFSETPDIAEIYQSIENPDSRLMALLNALPQDMDQKRTMIQKHLEDVKKVFDKCEPVFAQLLFKSFRSVGVHVANASGGMLGMGAVDKEEKAALELSFMKP